MHSRLPVETRQHLKEQVGRIAGERYANSTGDLELPFEITYAVARR
jgi:hypothetical protein